VGKSIVALSAIYLGVSKTMPPKQQKVAPDSTQFKLRLFRDIHPDGIFSDDLITKFNTKKDVDGYFVHNAIRIPEEFPVYVHKDESKTLTPDEMEYIKDDSVDVPSRFKIFNDNL
jgi:hypothetical protein